MRRNSLKRRISMMVCCSLLIPTVFATDVVEEEPADIIIEPPEGSWSFHSEYDTFGEQDEIEVPGAKDITIDEPEGNWSIPKQVEDDEAAPRASEFYADFDIGGASMEEHVLVSQTYKYLAETRLKVQGNWTPATAKISFQFINNSDGKGAFISLYSGESGTIYMPSTGTYKIVVRINGGVAAGRVTLTDG